MDLWSYAIAINPILDMPKSIDIMIQATAAVHNLKAKFTSTLEHWMKTESLYSRSTIFVFLSKNIFTIPTKVREIWLTELTNDRRQKIIIHGVQHWLIVVWAADLEAGIVPLLELDPPAAAIQKVYPTGSKRNLDTFVIAANH